MDVAEKRQNEATRTTLAKTHLEQYASHTSGHTGLQSLPHEQARTGSPLNTMQASVHQVLGW